MKEPYSRKESAWARMDEKERQETLAYGERYKAFLDRARTERPSALFGPEPAREAPTSAYRSRKHG